MVSRDIYTSDAEPGEVLIALTYPCGDTKCARLRVKDCLSGETLVEVELSPETWLEILSSTETRAQGARHTAHPHRIGKRSQNTSININTRDGDVDELAKEAELVYRAEGWEEIRIDKTNFGRRVVAYRWIPREA